MIGKERHDLGRPNDQGYPVRAMCATWTPKWKTAPDPFGMREQ